MLRFTLHFFVVTLTLSTTSCMTGAGETDSELVYRYFTRGKYDVPFFLIDKEYQGTAGKVFFVRFSEGDADTLLAIVGINKTASHDFAWLIGMTVKLHGSGTIKYLDYLAGDSVYRFVDTIEFWNDKTTWNRLLDEIDGDDTVMRSR